MTDGIVTVSVTRIRGEFIVCWGSTVADTKKFVTEAEARNHAALLMHMLPMIAPPVLRE